MADSVRDGVGIHGHPTRKTGLLAPKNAAYLQLKYLLTGVLPKTPVSVEHFKTVEFGLDGNDKYGVCGPTGLDNYQRLVSKALTGTQVSMTQEQVFDLYRLSGNPQFDPETDADDNGVILQTMLEAALKYGYGGIEPLVFAKVDHTNEAEIDAAVAIFGGVLWGVLLQQSQQTQSDKANGTWDYHAPHKTWGGHCVLNGEFTASGDRIISWDTPYSTTPEFRRHQLQEVWVVIYPWHFESEVFLKGINLKALPDYFKDLTGKTLVLPKSSKKRPAAPAKNDAAA